LVTTPKEPAGTPRDLRPDDVIDPGPRDAGPNILRIHSKDTVERSASLPIFIPPGLAAERTQLEPYIVQVQLSQEEQGVFVVGVDLQPRPRQGLTLYRLRQERGHECRTGGTQVPCGGLV